VKERKKGYRNFSKRIDMAMNTKTANNAVPFQVQNIIDGMLNSTDSIYVRMNYRSRLHEIRLAIDAAIKNYDNDLALKESNTKRKRKA